jgi:hypothetical protein
LNGPPGAIASCVSGKVTDPVGVRLVVFLEECDCLCDSILEEIEVLLLEAFHRDVARLENFNGDVDEIRVGRSLRTLTIAANTRTL